MSTVMMIEMILVVFIAPVMLGTCMMASEASVWLAIPILGFAADFAALNHLLVAHITA